MLNLAPTLLVSIMPRLKPSEVERMWAPLVSSMERFQVNTVTRVAMFLAQLAHESAELQKWEEEASGAAYEPPSRVATRLGNIHPGDGPRFKGRGPIQITGRDNYTRCGVALHLDLLAAPELLLITRHGFDSAGWYWRSRNLNAAADAGLFDRTTLVINGGMNGAEARRRYWAAAKKALGLE